MLVELPFKNFCSKGFFFLETGSPFLLLWNQLYFFLFRAMVVACFFFFGQLVVISEKEMGMAHFGMLAQSRALDSLVFLVSIFGLDPRTGKFVLQSTLADMGCVSPEGILFRLVSTWKATGKPCFFRCRLFAAYPFGVENIPKWRGFPRGLPSNPNPKGVPQRKTGRAHRFPSSGQCTCPAEARRPHPRRALRPKAS